MSSRDPQHYDLALVTRHVRPSAGDRVLEMGYYDPGAALWAARQGARVLALRPSVDLAADLEARGREAGLAGLEARLALEPEPAERGTFDVALLLAPFFLGNQPVRSALGTAAAALKPAGTLYFQVHRRHGGDTFVRFAGDYFDSVEQVDVGAGRRRLIKATGPRPGTTGAGSDADAGRQEVALHELYAGGAVVRFRLAAGGFGARGIDPASRLLVRTGVDQDRSPQSAVRGLEEDERRRTLRLRSGQAPDGEQGQSPLESLLSSGTEVPLPPRAAILDLGCGAGVIGLALAAAERSARVVL